MAGNSNSGRHSIPIHELAESSYRPGRHGVAPDAAAGVPEPARRLTGEARRHWLRIVPDLVARGLAKEIDGPALEQLCELWALYCAALKAAKKAPSDTDAGAAVVRYLREYQAIGKRFGLTPADRQKLRVPLVAEDDDGVATRPRIGAGVPSRDRAGG